MSNKPKRGRPPLKAKASVPTHGLRASFVAAAREGSAAVSSELARIEEKFGLPPYVPAVNEAQIRDRLVTGSKAFFETGALLLQRRAIEPRGHWLDFLERIGIGPRSAQQMMQAAVKLAPIREKLLGFGRGKLVDLLCLDDEPLKELTDGGSIADLKIDAYQRASWSELRAMLHEANEQSRAKDRLLADKDVKINELDESRYRPTEDAARAAAREQALIEAVMNEATTIRMALVRMREVLLTAVQRGELENRSRVRQSCEFDLKSIASNLLRAAETIGVDLYETHAVWWVNTDKKDSPAPAVDGSAPDGAAGGRGDETTH